MSTTTTRARTATKPARPDDKPFDFNLDAIEYDGDLSPFRVHYAGRRWTLTNMQQLDTWEVIEAARGGDITVVAGSLKLALGDQWEDFHKIGLPQWKLMPLFRAWKKHSGGDDTDDD